MFAVRLGDVETLIVMICEPSSSRDAEQIRKCNCVDRFGRAVMHIGSGTLRNASEACYQVRWLVAERDLVRRKSFKSIVCRRFVSRHETRISRIHVMTPFLWDICV